MDEEIRLRRGVQASTVAASLRPIVAQGSNVMAAGGPQDILTQQRLQNAYLGWVEDIERCLRHYFESSWVWDELFTPRWTEIRNLTRTSPRYQALIADEVETQQARLNAIVERLESSLAHFELEVGCIAIVPDTNVFLHYTFFSDINWAKLAKETGAKSVRLVVPLIVIEELDKQTYVDANANRAKAVLRALRKRLDLDHPEAPADLRAKVKVQLLAEPRGHRARANTDDEILDRAEYLASLVGESVHVATGDLNMQTRAVMRGLKCLVLSEDLRD